MPGCENANPAQGYNSPSVSSEDETMPEEENVSSQDEFFLYGRSFLSLTGQQVYDELSDKAEKYDFDTNILIPPQFEEYDVALITTYFYYDNPQYYWVVPEITLDEATGARTMRVTTAENLSPELIRKRQDEIDEAAKLFLKDIDGDTFDTVVAVHDRLVGQISRDTSFGAESGNIYGALVGKTAICDGYAKTFQYLMALSGIKCIYYQGESNGGTPHAWNAVYIEDDWYYVDVTWDALTSGRVLHTYLCITLEELLREREFSPGQYPEIVDAGSDKYNYFKQKGYAVSPDADISNLRALADAFVNGLDDKTLPDWESLQLLEVKVYATPADYRKIKDEFIQNPFLVLREMDNIAFQKNLPFEIATEGLINCNHKDLMQILILWPKVKKI